MEYENCSELQHYVTCSLRLEMVILLMHIYGYIYATYLWLWFNLCFRCDEMLMDVSGN